MPNSILDFLYENINASILHSFCILLSPIFFIFIHKKFYITIGLIGMILIIITNLMPVMLQRHLKPRLLNIYNNLKERENRTQNLNK